MRRTYGLRGGEPTPLVVAGTPPHPPPVVLSRGEEPHALPTWLSEAEAVSGRRVCVLWLLAAVCDAEGARAGGESARVGDA